MGAANTVRPALEIGLIPSKAAGTRQWQKTLPTEE